MKKIKKERLLLSCGIAAWIVYLLNLVLFSTLNSNYSHISNLVSDLGRVESTYHGLFNAGLFLFATLILLSAPGFYYSIKLITGKKIISLIVCISTILFSISLFFTAAFPLPDLRHSGYGIGLFYDLTPLLIAIAFFRYPGSKKILFHQLIFFVLIMIIRSINYGMLGIINESNIGLIQRLYVSILLMWFTSTAYMLIKDGDK